MKKPTNPYVAHYGKLIGKTVKQLVTDGDPSEAMYGLLFTDGTIAWIQRDEEGNGPGFLDIQKGG
jgi:hypothetical protein